MRASAKRRPRKRHDNMPDKMTAHAVRRLTCCAICRGLGDRTQMIHGDCHTSCFTERHGFKGLAALPLSESDKLRLDDLLKLSRVERIAIFQIRSTLLAKRNRAVRA